MKFTRKLFFSALMAVAATGQAVAQEWTEVLTQTFDDLSTTGINSGGLMGGGTTSGRYTSETEFSPAAWFNMGKGSFQVSASTFKSAAEWKMTFKYAVKGNSNVYLKKGGSNLAVIASGDFCTVNENSDEESALKWYDIELVGSTAAGSVTMKVTGDGAVEAYTTAKAVGSGFFNIDEIGFWGGNLAFMDEIHCYIVEENDGLMWIKNEDFSAVPANATGWGRAGGDAIGYCGGNKNTSGTMPLFIATLNADKYMLSVKVAMNKAGGFWFKNGSTNKFALEGVAGEGTLTATLKYNSTAVGGDHTFTFDNGTVADTELHWSTITIVGDKTADKVTVSAVDNKTGETIISATDINEFFFIDNIGSYVAGNAGFVYMDDLKFKVCEDATVDVAVTSAKVATYCTDLALDFSGVSGLKAYKAASSTASSVTMEELTQAPGNTGLYLVATGNTYKVPVLTEAAAVGTNLLKGVVAATAVAQESGDNYNFFLTDKGFNLAAESSTLAANKAYLQLSKDQFDASAARTLSVVFDGTTTGIGEIENGRQNIENGLYDLQGRRVSNVSKPGIYVKNGKKLIIK